MIIAWVNKCLSRLLSTVLIAYILITLLMQMEPTEVRWIPLRDMVHFFLSLVLEVCIVTCWITLSFDWVDSPRLPFGPSEAPCLRDGERSLLWQEKGKEGGSCSNRHEQFQFLHYLKTKKKIEHLLSVKLICSAGSYFKEEMKYLLSLIHSEGKYYLVLRGTIFSIWCWYCIVKCFTQ